ncbi:MAG: CoA ester lyase [Candidatus Cloacimonadales bacterium]|nr:CoA ester lyase [Candidatus Cloacimonadales bacterium]
MTWILRSLLFVPGNKERLIRKAANSAADALILDLEDSVIDASKQEARDVIKKMLKTGIAEKHHIFVRTNDLKSGFVEEDFTQLTLEGVTGFIVPKSYSKTDVLSYEQILQKYETEKRFPKNHFKLIPLIETASAVLHAEEICKASKRIIAIAFGSEDFCADILGIHDEDSNSLLTPRALIALAARAAGVIPIDTLHVRVHDLRDLKKNLKLARLLGFEGSLLLHPKEIEFAQLYFTPNQQETAKAELILNLTQEAASKNRGVAILDGVFIGPPMVRQAKQTLARNEAIKEWEESRK